MPTSIKLPVKPENNGDNNGNGDSRLIRNVTFFGDAAIPEDDPIYKAVWDAAYFLAEKNYKIVDGGGPGLMKAATDGAKSAGGKTKAVYWQPTLASYFEGKNLANVADESEASSNYVMRTLGLIENGDVYVVCEGGSGTISEFGLVWCLSKLYYGCHKPVILFGNRWDNLINAFQESMNIDDIELGVLYRANTPEEIYNIIIEHEKKLSHCAIKQVTGDEKGFVIGSKPDVTTANYNEHASEYHSKHAGTLPAKDQLDEFISMVNPPAKVLDIGTGTGFDAGYLSNKYSVMGIERSKRFFEIAQYECPNVNVINADFIDFDFKEEKFKGIWARDSIHHIKGELLNEAFKKVGDLLVQDGIFYVIVREGSGEVNESEKKDYGEIERFYHLFTPEELIDLARKAGMSLVKLDRTKRSHKWLIGVFRKD